MTKEDHRGAQSTSSLGDDSGEIPEDLASLNSAHLSPALGPLPNTGSSPDDWAQNGHNSKGPALSICLAHCAQSGRAFIDKKMCSLLSSWAFSEVVGVNRNMGISWGSRAPHEGIFTVPDCLYFCAHTRRHMCMTQVREPSPSCFTVREFCLLIWVPSLTLHLE